MSAAKTDSPLIVIVGPTASGKSALGIAIAKKFGGEIIACDSTQLYRGFDIGTAKPTLAERAEVPHHLLDVLEADEPSTAGDYRERAEIILADIKSRGKLAIVTVGTGLYLRALLEGLADLPQRSEELRNRLRATAATHGPRYLHAVLKKLDAETAGKIAPADEQKIIRAIEVCLLTSKPLSEVHRTARKPLLGWHAVKIGLQPPRDALADRLATSGVETEPARRIGRRGVRRPADRHLDGLPASVGERGGIEHSFQPCASRRRAARGERQRERKDLPGTDPHGNLLCCRRERTNRS